MSSEFIDLLRMAPFAVMQLGTFEIKGILYSNALATFVAVEIFSHYLAINSRRGIVAQKMKSVFFERKMMQARSNTSKEPYLRGGSQNIKYRGWSRLPPLAKEQYKSYIIIKMNVYSKVISPKKGTVKARPMNQLANTI